MGASSDARLAEALPKAAQSAPAPVVDEAERQRKLDQLKGRATLLLVLSGVVFVVARWLEPRYPWLGYVRATAEASLVGGLADWFAVTALFRRPMGLPIPHTAIIPSRKDRLGRTIAAFVQRNFLTREVIEARLRTLRIGEKLARWVAQPENARTIARQAASALASGAQMLRDDDVRALIDKSVEERIRATKVAPIAAKVLAVVAESNQHQELLNEAVVMLARALEQNRDLIRQRVQQESPWWVPNAVDEKIYKKIMVGIGRTLTAVQSDPHHPLRARFDQALRTFIDNLQHSPDTGARAEAIKRDFLEAEAVRRFSASLWSDAKDALIRFADQPDEVAREGGAVERAVTTFGEAIANDPELVRQLDSAVTDVAAFLVTRYQNDVAEFIVHTVENWDAEVTANRVELAIGRDLQYIRINGTLVGALAGLAIYTLSKLAP
ncbi:MAG: DUF445 domain-containing protein [Gemmatimonadota bacterium]|mgnify:FL=1